jgi:hypothetical protein
MSDEIKPLKWTPGPEVGYTVKRRPDGGMHTYRCQPRRWRIGGLRASLID